MNYTIHIRDRESPYFPWSFPIDAADDSAAISAARGSIVPHDTNITARVVLSDGRHYTAFWRRRNRGEWIIAGKFEAEATFPPGSTDDDIASIMLSRRLEKLRS